jgi:hypothetical protein
MSAANISITKGDDTAINLTVTHSTGAPFDLTGCSLRLRIRRSFNSTDTLTKLVTTYDNPQSGSASFGLTTADTAALDTRAYVYKIELIDADVRTRSTGFNYARVTNFSTGVNNASLTMGTTDNIDIAITPATDSNSDLSGSYIGLPFGLTYA